MDLEFGFFGETDDVPVADFSKLQAIIRKSKGQDSNASVTFLFDDEKNPDLDYKISHENFLATSEYVEKSLNFHFNTDNNSPKSDNAQTLNHSENNVKSTIKPKSQSSINNTDDTESLKRTNSRCHGDEQVSSTVQNGTENSNVHNGANSASKEHQTPLVTSETTPQNATKSWANIVGDAHAGLSINVSPSQKNKTPDKQTHKQRGGGGDTPKINPGPIRKTVPAEDDVLAQQIGELLRGFHPTWQHKALQPRGLYNARNWCYVNAILQALIASPSVHDLLLHLSLAAESGRHTTSTPVLDAMVSFAAEFSAMVESRSSTQEDLKRKPEVVTGQPFRPDVVHRMLDLLQSDIRFNLGRQEDAEEFLSVILNALHDEMSAAMKLAAADDAPDEGEKGDVEEEAKAEGGEEDWEQVGPKNKSQVTRTATRDMSPIADIFGGCLRSVVQSSGSKESATLQPFFTIPLDIQGCDVTNVRQALHHMAVKEMLEGYTCTKTNAEIEATRRTTIDELPQVLVLHLKWFVYNKEGGVMKIKDKHIEFETDLDISKDLLSHSGAKRYSPSQRKYKLFAVITHHGQKALSGGHYTVDINYNFRDNPKNDARGAPVRPAPPSDVWIRFDDARVTTVNTANVLKYVSPRVPYLLFYRRLGH